LAALEEEQEQEQVPPKDLEEEVVRRFYRCLGLARSQRRTGHLKDHDYDMLCEQLKTNLIIPSLNHTTIPIPHHLIGHNYSDVQKFTQILEKNYSQINLSSIY
jgi:hypothetical protein